MLYVDTKTWLPDELLVKADKMTMATSTELRVPLLDQVLEFAAALPSNFKVKNLSRRNEYFEPPSPNGSRPLSCGGRRRDFRCRTHNG